MVYEDASVASVQLLKFTLLSFISHKTIAVCSCLVSLLVTMVMSQENFPLFSLKNSLPAHRQTKMRLGNQTVH